MGGKAQVYMNLGDWTNAVSNAANVPNDFVYESVHSRNSSREENMLMWWYHDRAETTIWGTPFLQWAREINSDDGDPRILYEDTGELGLDGTRPHYRQKKYPDYGTNIPIIKGTEMRLIEGESMLLNNDIDGLVGKINTVRNFHGLDDIEEVPANINDAWFLLMKERGIELWLGGRRIGDLRRWQETPGEVPFDVIREDHETPLNVINSEDPGMFLMVGQHEHDSNVNLIGGGN